MTNGYLSHPMQEYRVRKVTIEEGRARGLRLIEVSTSAGLDIDLFPDHGLDIGQVRYRGTNMTFISKNGYSAPSAAQAFGSEFLRYFPGGLLYTCGLRSTGPEHEDNGEWHPLHGRYHLQPAEMISTRENEESFVIEGTVREASLFGPVLSLHRVIEIPKNGSSICVYDSIRNETPMEQEYALLYHCNFGWPLVSDQAHLELDPERKATPRTPFAATGLGRELTFDAPVPGEEERVFFHENMQAEAAIANPSLGVRMKMTWSDTLPILAHWRSMASGDYVCGLEPTNCYIMGRKQERENGTLPVLAPGAFINTSLTFSFESI